MIDRMTGTLTESHITLLALDSLGPTEGLQRLFEAATSIQHAEAMIEVEAANLVEQFRETRTRLRDAEALRRDVEGDKDASSLYSPLNVAFRINKGLLEIYWFAQHKGPKTGKPSYKYISRGKAKGQGYHLTGLLGHARPYERELVKEIEARAENIRIRRADLVAVRRAVHKLLRSYELAVASVPSPAIDDPASASGFVPLRQAS
jgi:hypothetical protein